MRGNFRRLPGVWEGIASQELGPTSAGYQPRPSAATHFGRLAIRVRLPAMVALEAAAAGPLAGDELRLIDAWWRAANYLSVGQIYLLDNPLLREPLAAEHVKPRLLGHWGTTPGLNLIWAHLNRVIRARDLDVLYVTGPGHGGPASSPTPTSRAPTASSIAQIGRDERGLQRLFRQFSFPGGIPSHAAPETPGSIHEGGELGYALAHAFGAAFDNPGLIVACVIGDGEAETGPLAASWHANKFLNPATRRRGAADPAPQRLQDRQPHGARPHPRARAARAARRATAGARCSSGGFDGEDPAACTSCWPRRSTRRSTRSPHPGDGAREAAEPSARPGR